MVRSTKIHSRPNRCKTKTIQKFKPARNEGGAVQNKDKKERRDAWTTHFAAASEEIPTICPIVLSRECRDRKRAQRRRQKKARRKRKGAFKPGTLDGIESDTQASLGESTKNWAMSLNQLDLHLDKILQKTDLYQDKDSKWVEAEKNWLAMHTQDYFVRATALQTQLQVISYLFSS
jgi:hypothetical protein